MSGRKRRWTKHTVMGITVYKDSSEHRGGGRGNFNFCVQGHLSEDECAKLQTELHYHPAGYGLYGLKHGVSKSGKNYTMWSCWANCE